MKRCRQDMSKPRSSSSNSLVGVKATKTMPRQVHFASQEAEVIDTTDAAEGEPTPYSSWYTKDELSAQFKASKKFLVSWQEEGFAVLLANSYEQPHVNVQEYLLAFVCQHISGNDTEDEFSVRGLEANANAHHAYERSRLKKRHRRTLLSQQDLLRQFGQEDVDKAWERLAQASRESSALAKLFAARLGRADARCVLWLNAATSTSNFNAAAQEIVQAHEQKRQQQQLLQQKRRQSLSPPLPTPTTPPPTERSLVSSLRSSHTSSQPATPPQPPTSIATPNNSNQSQIIQVRPYWQHCHQNTLTSLICLESPRAKKIIVTGSLNQSPKMMTSLPLQDVVYGRYTVKISS